MCRLRGVWPWFVNLSHTFYHVIVGAGRRFDVCVCVVAGVCFCMHLDVGQYGEQGESVHWHTTGCGGEGCEVGATLTCLWTRGGGAHGGGPQ